MLSLKEEKEEAKEEREREKKRKRNKKITTENNKIRGALNIPSVFISVAFIQSSPLLVRCRLPFPSCELIKTRRALDECDIFQSFSF